MIYIYTDGACDHNHKGSDNRGAYAYAAVNEFGIKIQEFANCERNTTNNRMELRAVICALKYCSFAVSSLEKVTIMSDSTYVVDSITKEWYLKWDKNNWKRGKSDVPNADLWKELVALLHRSDTFYRNVTFKWVKGHNGNEWNEYVDKLAQKEIDVLKRYKVINK